MKRYLFLITFLFVAAYGQAQQYRMLVKGAPSWTNLGGGQYQATVQIWSDLTGNSYLPTGVTDTMDFFTSRGQRFEVDTVWGATASQVTIRVTYSEGLNSAPTGQGMIFEPYGSVFVPDAPFGSTGATAQLNAAIVAYNAAKSGIVEGNTIASASYNALTGLLTLTQVDGGTVTVTAKQIDVRANAPTGTPTFPMAVDTTGIDTVYFANNGAWVMFEAGDLTTGGNLTTLDGTAIDAGGTAVENTTFDMDGFTFSITDAGTITLVGRASTGTANDIILTAGNQTSGGGTGGAVNITGGNGTSSNGAGGEVTITAGNATASGGNGGDLNLYGGDKTGAGDGDGGNVVLQPGTKTGGGSEGQIQMLKATGSLGSGSMGFDLGSLSGGHKTLTIQNINGTIALTSDIPSGILPLGTAGQLLKVNAGATALEYFTPTYLTSISLTGDVTGSGSSSIATTIANDAVTYAKMQNVSATSRFLGRITAGAGDPEELTGTQATTLLDVFTSGLKGLVPASGGGTTNFLRADGTWTTPAGSGDVVGPGSATDNAIVRFDGTTGKLIQNSGLLIDDSGNITGPSAGFTITGGTSTTADLSFKTTSGVGASGADMHFLVGNNGATEAMTILNSGLVGVGISPTETIDVNGGVRLRNASTGVNDGTLRYTGTDLEGRIGGAWKSLTQQGTVTGSGTTNTIPKWTGSGTLGNSNITNSTGAVTIADSKVTLNGALSQALTSASGERLLISNAGYNDPTSSGNISFVNTSYIHGGSYTSTNALNTYQLAALNVVAPSRSGNFTATNNAIFAIVTTGDNYFQGRSFYTSYWTPGLKPIAYLEVFGNNGAWSAAPDNTGVGLFRSVAQIAFNDPFTAASGTRANAHLNVFGIPVLTATNSSVTYTNSATVYIEGAPTGTAGNPAITNPYALWIDAGRLRFDGPLNVNGSEGTSGQVLTSQGAGATPAWTTLTATIGGSIAANQVAFGSGSNTIQGSANLTFVSNQLLNTASGIAYSFLGDTDAGLGRTGTDAIRLYTANATAIDINSSQEVGIKTTATSGLALTVGGQTRSNGNILSAGTGSTAGQSGTASFRMLNTTGGTFTTEWLLTDAGITRMYHNNGNIAYQLNADQSHIYSVGDNLATAYTLQIQGGSAHLIVTSTDGAEVTEIGSEAASASLILNATPNDSTTMKLVGLDANDVAKELKLFEQLSNQTAADTILSLPARHNFILASLAGGAFTTTIPNPKAEYKGIVIEFARVNGNFTTDVWTVTTVSGSNGFYNDNAAANTITFQSTTTASRRVRCIQNGASYFWAVIK